MLTSLLHLPLVSFFSNLFSVDRKPLFVVWPARFFSFVVVIVCTLRGQ